jgi:hypothetical protein
MLLQGQEFLESRPFGDGVEHRIDWRKRERNADFLRFVKDAIRLRRTQPALRSDARQNVYHVNDGANVLAFQRWTDAGGDLVIVASLANGDLDGYRLGFPLPGEWFEVLNGDAALYGGRNRGNGGRVVAAGPGMHGLAQSATITIPRMGVLVFARQPIAVEPEPGFRRGDCNGDGAVDLADPVRGLAILFRGVPPGDCPAACDANGDGGMNIADATRLLAFLFTAGPPPPAPWPECASGASPLACGERCGGE